VHDHDGELEQVRDRDGELERVQDRDGEFERVRDRDGESPESCFFFFARSVRLIASDFIST
jgi:hypothetical protein